MHDRADSPEHQRRDATVPHHQAMTTRLLLVRLFLALGLALLGAGLVLGLLPVHPGGARCGTAFTKGEDANPFLRVGPECEQARSDARTPAVLLLVLGGALLVPAVVLALPSTEGSPSSAADVRG